MRMSHPPTKDDLLRVLQTAIGRGNGLSAEQLAYHLGSHPRNVRTLITALRQDGIAVCGQPETGYFIAKTADELEQTCQFLRNRAMCSLELEARMRRIPLPDLLGQLHLPT